MHRFRRIAGSAVLAAALITGGMAAATPVEVAAASTTEKLIYGAAALLPVSQYYSKLDDQGQAQFYEQCRRQTGVDENPADNNRVQRIYQSRACGIREVLSVITRFMYLLIRILMPSCLLAGSCVSIRGH